MPGERFSVRLLPEDGGGTGERVIAEVGLEGFNILATSGGRTLRKYPLHHISRWSMRGTSLVLFTRSPSDVEDRSLTLEGDETTIRSVLDTLTCSCMQMAEMLQSGQSADGGSQVAANSLVALLKKSKKPALLTADQVEFWRQPEKAGWMHSQGEHIRTWRKRWFVLKQGFLFRFASSDVTAASKPRGIVDLSTVTDVADGSATTGRPNSIKLSTATGHICYLCESETSQVEWYSALEGAVARIVKLVAGVDEEEERPAKPSSRSWAEQLEKTFASVGSSSGARRSSAASTDWGRSSGVGGEGGGGSSRPHMINVVNYEAQNGGQHAASLGGSGGLAGSGGAGYITVDYGSIAGANVVADDGRSGGGYAPSMQPPANYGYQQQQGYARLQQPGEAGGHGGNLMDAVTAPQAGMQGGSPWRVHYTGDGRPYYHNAATGVTQWEPPA